MSRSANLAALALSVIIAAPALAGPTGLGRPATPGEIAAWDRDVRPDGMGLPPGGGTVLEGEEVFLDNCVACHGDFGEGVGRFPPLAGGQGTLTDDRPVKTIGSYWPHLSTAYDYIRRAQPFGAPGTLSDDEIYAVVAYILYLNDIVEDEDFRLSAENLASIRLPNADGFIEDDRPDTPTLADGAPCMKNCGPAPEITSRASDLDLGDTGNGGE